MWQKCPICNGSGFVHPYYETTNGLHTNVCPTCNGDRIISSLNGKPPSYKPESVSDKTPFEAVKIQDLTKEATR